MRKTITKDKFEVVLDIPEDKMNDYKEAFDMFDIDKTGHVSANEIFKVMKNMGNELTLKEIKAMIADLDSDGTGEIRFNEFITFIQKTQVIEEVTDEEEVIRAFKTFDKEDSGFLSCAEFKHILCNLGDKFTDCEANEIFKEADLDQDGKLNYCEFVEFWRNK